MSLKKNILYSYNTNLNKVELSFLDSSDYCLLSNWDIKQIDGNLDINQLLKLSSTESGLLLNFEITESLAAECSNLLHEVLKEKQNQLYTTQKWTFLSCTELSNSNDLLFFSWDFLVKESSISKQEWVNKNNLIPYNCCQRTFLLQNPDFIFKSIVLENEKLLEKYCQYKTPFMDINTTVAFSSLSEIDENLLNILSKNRFSRDFLLNLKENQKLFSNSMFGQEYICQFLSLSSFNSALELSKKLPKKVLNQLHECNFLDISEASCLDFIFSLNKNTYKQLLTNIFVTMYANQLFIQFGHLNNQEIKIKLLGGCVSLNTNNHI